jgi:A/G-specific adenine glycosylase
LIPAEDIPEIRRRLLRWFKRHQRSLPWRANRDPYRIWLSEIMLQQTLVATVVPYFERFLASFPTLADLARAEEQTVLRLWEGLGYYSRARNLHRAAQIIVTDHGGQFPRDAEAAARLPGIGRYTLGAILSQAFDLPMPILEANSQRVLCRLFARPGDPREAAQRKWLWHAAAALVPPRRAGDFNQALMELGALICSPREPACSRCPLQTVCAAWRLGTQAEIPPPARRPATRQVAEVAIVIRKSGKLLIVQRPSAGRWANLWEFPHGEVLPGENHEQAAARLVHQLTGMATAIQGELLTIKHGVTHHQITVVCFEAMHQGGQFVSKFYQRGQWIDPLRLEEFPVSSPQRRVAKYLLRDDRQQSMY